MDLKNFIIKGQIGIGAGSKILLAKELRTGKLYAIKHVVRSTADDDRFVNQVENEYRVSTRIDHPNIRKSHFIHRTRKFLQTREVMLVMEYVEAIPLQDARPAQLDAFLGICQQVAAGLHAMHESGFVHADIKPINILIGDGGLVKIIDLGQACAMGLRKERVQGTPDYIAPEQVRRANLDQRTDVFNLGATMYWALTNENYPTAIASERTAKELSLASAKRPIAPIEFNDKIPLALSRLVMECCKENPAERPTDMKQLSARLSAIVKLWQKQQGATVQRDDTRRPAGPGSVPAERENKPGSDEAVA